MSVNRPAGPDTFREVTREFTWATDFLNNVAVKNRVYGLIEIDVTKARRWIAEEESRTGERLSFTAWVVKCVAEAVSEHKQIQGFKKGKTRIIVFDDVDVAITIEREVRSEMVPLGYVIRRANNKTFREIHEEIRRAQKQEVSGIVLGSERLPWYVGLFQRLPALLRKPVYWKLRSDPFLKKRLMGTISVTAVGMFGRGGGWPIMIGFHSLDIGIGGISRRPKPPTTSNETGEYLSMTVMVDEEVSYGGPAARFIATLADLMQSGHGLEAQ